MREDRIEGPRNPTPTLPYIDTHVVDVAADPKQTWQALLDLVDGNRARRGGRALVQLLGCSPRRSRGSPGAVGSAVPGFLVVESQPPKVLRLAGSHRFSCYTLEFGIEPLGDFASLVRAESRASFLGPFGSPYRWLVVGTGLHVVAVKAILIDLKRKAERPGTRVTNPPPPSSPAPR